MLRTNPVKQALWPRLKTVNLRFKHSKAPSSLVSVASISPSKISQWQTALKSDPVTQLAAAALRTHNAHDVLINRDRYINDNLDIFSNVISTEGSPITNQKASGRCWLFAGTNLMRPAIMEKYKIKHFQLSPSFLFFYDKLEKSNWFLEQIIASESESVDSRLVQHLLLDPIGDGGQFAMFSNLVEKYGIVPDTIFPDSYNTTASRQMNEMVTTKLREYAMILRDLVSKEQWDEVAKAKIEQQQEIHRLLILFMGTPPGPNDEFKWEYKDKDKKYHSLLTTPTKFYKDVVNFNCSETVSLLNDPRNDYNRKINIDKLGNVVGGAPVEYLNVECDTLTNMAIDRILNNKPVFFGTHTPIFHDKKTGIIDNKLWQYDLINYHTSQSKADRLRYRQSLMTHAMLFTGVHLEDGKPIKWRVENSWGKDVGKKGYFTMTHDFFKEYVYQVVVEKSELEKFGLKQYLEGEPIVLPPWDPCGALATN